MEPLQISSRQARRYLIRYHHLTDDTALEPEGIVDFVRQVGCIQFDPLDVVGRNPELVLQSRCGGYRRGDLDRLLYGERRLFDVWDKNMSICPVEDWPCFSRHRARMAKDVQRLEKAIGYITAHLQEHESANSSDLGLDEKVGWAWGPQRLAKAALECMCYAGLAVVHHKKGNRRHYCLPERYIPGHILDLPDPHPTEESYSKWIVRRRMGAVGLLWNRGGDAWLGTVGFKAPQRELGFAGLLEDGAILPVQVEGLRHPLYLPAEYREDLLAAGELPFPGDNVRILAPLDNLLWERKLVEELFGFSYRWEVYTPASRRKYGYYVLPVLWGDRFAGRIELETDRKNSQLIVRSLWWEKDMAGKKRECARSLRACLRRFAAYNRCGDVSYACRI